MNLRNRLMLYISIPVILTLVALSMFTYYQASEALDIQIRRAAANLAESSSNDIQKRLAEKEAVVSVISKELSVFIPEETDLRRVMEKLQKDTPGIQLAFVGLADRRMIDSSGKARPPEYDPRARGWYKQGVETQGIAYTDVYLDSTTKKPVISIVQAIRSGNQVVGVVGVDLALDEVSEVAKSIKVGKTGNAFILNREGGYIYHETLKFEDNIFKLQNGAFAAPGKEFLSGKPSFQTFTFGGVKKIYASTPVGKTGWSIVLAAPQNEFFETITTMGIMSAFGSFIGVIVIMLVLFFIARNISRPLIESARRIEIMANGDYSADIEKASLARSDEFGVMAKAFDKLNRNMRTIISQVSHSSEQVAASAEELTASAGQSADAASNIAASIQQVAWGSEKQVAAVNETSAIVEEIAATMEEVSATASEMAVMSGQTSKAAVEGKASVDRAITQMADVSVGAKQVQTAVEELKGSSAQIGEIVGLISTIAGQTNLLALNAAIEAARAGEQGRGFAVVADEVRKLAEQSEQAARQIKTLVDSNYSSIGNVVGAIDEAIDNITRGVELVNVAGESFGAINGQIVQVSDQVSIIAKAINEAAIGSQRIVSSIKDVEKLSRDAATESQSVSAATEEQSASMEEITASSQALAKLAENLQAAVARFRI